MKPSCVQSSNERGSDESKPNAFSRTGVPRNTKNEHAHHLSVMLDLSPNDLEVQSKHPLLAKFSEALSGYKAQLCNTIAESLEDARQRVEIAHTEAIGTSKHRLQDFSALRDLLNLPLEDELLILTHNKGKETETKTTATLKERMNRFNQILSKESSRLERLQKELRETNEEIKALGQSVCPDSYPREDSQLAQCKGTEYSSAASELLDEYNQRKQECLAKFEADIESLQRRVAAAEEHDLLHSRDAEKQVQQLLQMAMDSRDK